MNKPPLNETAEELTSSLGFTAVGRLISLYSNSHIYVPSGAPEGHCLEKLIGKPAYVRLCAEYGGETLWIPENTDAHRIALIRAVAGLIRSGRRINDIADTIQMSPRQVMRYRVAAEELGLLNMVIRERGGANG